MSHKEPPAALAVLLVANYAMDVPPAAPGGLAAGLFVSIPAAPRVVGTETEFALQDKRVFLRRKGKGRLWRPLSNIKEPARLNPFFAPRWLCYSATLRIGLLRPCRAGDARRGRRAVGAGPTARRFVWQPGNGDYFYLPDGVSRARSVARDASRAQSKVTTSGCAAPNTRRAVCVASSSVPTASRRSSSVDPSSSKSATA